MHFDRSRAKLWGRSRFQPFRVTDGEPLQKLVEAGRIGRNQDLLVMERFSQRLAFTTRQMAYHHVAQGEMAGNPYMVTF